MHSIKIIDEILEELNSDNYSFNESENLFEILNPSYAEYNDIKNLVNLTFILNEKNIPHDVFEGYKVKLI